MEDIENLAFELLRHVLTEKNCKEVVILKLMKEKDLSLEDAEAAVDVAFEKWENIYCE